MPDWKNGDVCFEARVAVKDGNRAYGVPGRIGGDYETPMRAHLADTVSSQQLAKEGHYTLLSKDKACEEECAGHVIEGIIIGFGS